MVSSTIIVLFLNVISLVCSLNNGASCYHRKKNARGVCLDIQDCEGIEDELKNNIVPQFCNYPSVCCVLHSTRRFPLVSESKCREYSRMIQKSSSFYEADDKIVNGTDAKLGEFPHFAELGYGDYPYTWKCGASLISENFVLTAAHCTSEHNPVTAVQFGDVVLDSHQSRTYGVFRTYVHPEYSPGISYHDIALLELEETVEFTPYIKPACLPRSTNELQQKLVATGFGLLDFTDFANSYKLQKVTLDFFPFNRCNQKFGGGNKFPEGIQEKFQICYGGRRDRKDTCLGDSGGPLQYYEYEISLFRVIGIVSQGGRRCGRPGFPGIYTRVSHYLAWIVPIVWG